MDPFQIKFNICNIIYIPQTTLACGGSYLLCKEVESSVGVRAWWTLGLRLGLGLRAEG